MLVIVLRDIWGECQRVYVCGGRCDARDGGAGEMN
jgi:hypothetical protein